MPAAAASTTGDSPGWRCCTVLLLPVLAAAWRLCAVLVPFRGREPGPGLDSWAKRGLHRYDSRWYVLLMILQQQQQQTRWQHKLLSMAVTDVESCQCCTEGTACCCCSAQHNSYYIKLQGRVSCWLDCGGTQGLHCAMTILLCGAMALSHGHACCQVHLLTLSTKPTFPPALAALGS
jgi:hypothetical protein